MSEKCRNNNNNSDNPLTSRRTDGGKNKIDLGWGPSPAKYDGPSCAHYLYSMLDNHVRLTQVVGLDWVYLHDTIHYDGIVTEKAENS